MKKVWSIALAAVVCAAALAGCGGGGGSAGGKKVGVVQLAPHPALDACYEGFVDALAEGGFVVGENLTIDLQNAEGEIANCPTIASKLVNDKNDLILAIATPAAQAAANATSEIPILGTAITDFVEASLVQSNEAPGGNVSGTSDLTPVAEQLDLLMQLAPDVTSVGFLYCSSEANSIIQVEMAKAAADERGLSYEEFTVSSTNEIQSVTQSMVGKVDAIYTPTDNMIANAVSTVAAIARDNKIPFIVGEEGMCAGGGLASASINYYDLGWMTGEQAVKILKGEAEPATLPIGYQAAEDVEHVINGATAEALGIAVPDGFTVLGEGDEAADEGAEDQGDQAEADASEAGEAEASAVSAAEEAAASSSAA